MLVELSIRDLALFEEAELSFGPGLNVVTGETGAGKSLLIGALELLLGRAPKSKLLRRGAQSARVDGRFLFTSETLPPRLVGWLRERLPELLDTEEDELELVLSRTLSADGRTRAHVNHRPVTRALLRELAGLLVEVHGQNDHQRLLDTAEQLRLLDAFGGHEKLLAGYRARREHWLELSERLRDWTLEEAERRDRLELLRYQVRELDGAHLSPEEAGELTAERRLLRHGEELASELGGLLGELAESDDAALDVVRRAERSLDRWQERLEELSETAGEMRAACAHLEEAAARLRSFVDGLEFSPARLEEVEERLEEYERLQRRHRVDLAGLCALPAGLRAELERLEAEVVGQEELAAQVEQAHAELAEAAKALGRARRKLRKRLQTEVELSLGELGLQHARFVVSIEERSVAKAASPNQDEASSDAQAERRRLASDGADLVEFQLAANPGEGLKPLREVASGGESARIMLALRRSLAARHSIPALVFDEVDAGVGGRLAPKIGEHLHALGEHYQILCVTHLPAVAARADQHLGVRKRRVKGRTLTEVLPLDGETRVKEIADMISGGAEHDSALSEARRLLTAQ